MVSKRPQNPGPSYPETPELRRRWPWPDVKPLAGLMIPLFSIRTSKSCGCGDFGDIPAIVDWCSDVGISLIQLLPLNDTGDDPSPYSAISSLALNPVFCSFDMIPDLDVGELDLTFLRQELEAPVRFDYAHVRRVKFEVLRKIFDINRESLVRHRVFQAFCKKNPWLEEYAVFCILKDRFERHWWREWPLAYQQGTKTLCATIQQENPDDFLFHQFVQWILDFQLRSAHDTARKKKIALKGDIPILMNDDSVDVWMHPEYFITKVRAGAPPDMFTDKGQNWGFPIYRWPALARDDYSWWINRLHHAEEYYDALRIDHVLGFFRLWTIPSSEKTARLGYFVPSVPIGERTLLKIGLTLPEISRYSQPFISRRAINEAFGPSSRSIIRKYFTPSDLKGYYRFKPDIVGEKDLEVRAGSDESLLETLWRFWADRLLLIDRESSKQFHFRWSSRETTAYQTLSTAVQKAIGSFRIAYERKQNALWLERATTLLSMIADNTRMLICAEDLGYVPPVVRPLLEKMSMFTLKVHRWEKDYGTQPSRFLDPATYNPLSVNTLSVHDSTTLRGWWEESSQETQQFYAAIGMKGQSPSYLTTENASKSLAYGLSARSLLTVLAFQDYLSVSYDFRTYHPWEERINVPGKIADTNWSWRMKNTIEELRSRKDITKSIRVLIRKSGRLPAFRKIGTD